MLELLKKNDCQVFDFVFQPQGERGPPGVPAPRGPKGYKVCAISRVAILGDDGYHGDDVFPW